MNRSQTVGSGVFRLDNAERGSAVVDFVLVSTLVIAVALALMQIALGLHVRTVLIDAAGEGARRAALVGGTVEEAEQRVRTLSNLALRDDYVDIVNVRRVEVDGLTLVDVEVVAPFPLIGFFGPEGTLHVHGHAVDERTLTDSHRGIP
ncbi:TadE family protein [Actinomyces vulturis]|uniref:TadE family protein n=1 Tax=Actinomyces vulturis TaxID=1857645 RepID=UPI001FDF64A0|nr:TadE/TadG family type IV pilus assembly protein [Actinomyces vulturis]